MKRWICFLTVCFWLVSSDAFAELTYAELQHSYRMTGDESRAVLDNYLLGVYEGINASNIAHYMQTKNLLYCKPPEFELNVNDIRSIIKESHEAFDAEGEIPVSYLLFIGLKQTFPCL